MWLVMDNDSLIWLADFVDGNLLLLWILGMLKVVRDHRHHHVRIICVNFFDWACERDQVVFVLAQVLYTDG